jgi:integrase
MSEIKDATFGEISKAHLKMITKKTANKDHEYVDKLIPFIGGIYMSELIRPKELNLAVPSYALNKYVLKRAMDGVTANTVNKELSLVNTIGKKAIKEYALLSRRSWENIRLLDESEITRWNFKPSRIRLHLEPEWEAELLKNLSPLLQDMVTFSIHTGQRESIVCNLRWSWLHIDTYSNKKITYFRVPKTFMKSSRYMKEDAYVVLNDIALAQVYRHKSDSSYVFTVKGKPISQMNCTEYKSARLSASKKYPDIMNTDVHSFKRTFITRMIDADVPYEWVQRLANHKLPEITEQYNKMSPRKRVVMHQYVQRLTRKEEDNAF